MPTSPRHRWISRAVALYVAAFFILYCFPFDFRFSFPPPRPDLGFPDDPDWSALLGHCLLFALPGILLGLRRLEPAWSFATFAAAAVAALLIETTQLFVASRNAGLLDGSANVCGLAAGIVFGRCVAESPHWPRVWAVGTDVSLRAAAASWKWLQSRRIALVVLLLVSTAAGIVLRLPAGHELSMWDLDYPLLLANENTHDRAWRGQIRDVCIYDRGLSAGEVHTLTEEIRRGARDLSIEPRIRYRLTPASAASEDSPLRILEDVAPRTPDVPLHQVRGSPLKTRATRGLEICTSTTLATTDPPRELYRRIVANQGFTVAAFIRPEHLRLGGPARIVSSSINPYGRNFTLAQEDDAIHFRLRNRATGPNGSSPELIARQCLAKDRAHVVVAVYGDAQSRVYVDGRRRGTLSFRLYRPLLEPLVRNSDVDAAHLVATFAEWLWYMALFAILLAPHIQNPARHELAAVSAATTWLAVVLAIPIVF